MDHSLSCTGEGTKVACSMSQSSELCSCPSPQWPCGDSGNQLFAWPIRRKVGRSSEAACSRGVESDLASVGRLHWESIIWQGLYLFGNSRNQTLDS